MAKNPTIGLAVSSDLYARYAALDLARRRRVLTALRQTLARELGDQDRDPAPSPPAAEPTAHQHSGAPKTLQNPALPSSTLPVSPDRPQARPHLPLDGW
ncbi:hypothetical protein [Thiomonas sp. FB-Cd]|uniref:hypothetical protein n=1 Tax=Thiomonas sp. FB-Cd TaxID=1158292 RepID=UPI0012DF3F22|nr:hypothetical protein [Thiomonas sp. FB-Cd]